MTGQTNGNVSGAEVEPDYYALLGVAPTATPEELRRAYGARALNAQQDRETFENLGVAWEELKDPARRAAYDRRRTAAPVTNRAAGKEATRMGTGNVTAMPSMATTQMSASGGQLTVIAPPTQTAGDPNRTQAFSLPPCPVCGTPGVPGEEFCVECGLLTGSQVGEQVSERPLPKLTETETGREWLLHTGESIVGREGAEVMLPDKSVSRRHARFAVEENGIVYLEDMGSTNGTKHLGTPLSANKRVRIMDGAMLHFGSVKVIASVPPAEKEPELLSLPAPDTGAAQKTILALSAPEGAQNASARLVGTSGTHTLAGTRTTFGRRATNDIVLTGDTFVSGAHAVVVYESGKFKLVDLGSTNGTKLNGQRVIPNIALPLTDGDEVIMGQTAFKFRAPGMG